MKRLLAFLVLLTSTTAYAQPGSVLLIEDSGYFLLHTVNGVPTVKDLSEAPVPFTVTNVLDRRGDAPTDPDSPGDPPTPPDNELSRQAREWALEANDPAGAQALSLVYHTIAEANLPVETGIIVLREASDIALVSLGVQDKWVSFRKKASEALTTRRQQGLITTPKDLSDFMIAVALGIASAADGSEALDFPTVLSIVDHINTEIDKASR